MRRKLKVDMDDFIGAFGRDVDFHDTCPLSVYLDLETGFVFWVYEEDEDASWFGGIPEAENKRNREQIIAFPERYLEIPGFGHGDHHMILRDFLESEWTDDKDLWKKTKAAYFGSIGGWREKVEDDSIVYTYYDYRYSVIEKEAMKYLEEHGIEPI